MGVLFLVFPVILFLVKGQYSMIILLRQKKKYR